MASRNLEQHGAKIRSAMRRNALTIIRLDKAD
jgi:hypothetical protein